MRPERTVAGSGSSMEHVEARSTQTTRAERRQRDASSSSRAPRATFTTIAPAREQRQPPRIEQPARRCGKWRGQHEHVRVWELRSRSARADHLARNRPARRVPAGDAHRCSWRPAPSNRRATARPMPPVPTTSTRRSATSRSAGLRVMKGHLVPAPPPPAARTARSRPRTKCSTPASTVSAIGFAVHAGAVGEASAPADSSSGVMDSPHARRGRCAPTAAAAPRPPAPRAARSRSTPRRRATACRVSSLTALGAVARSNRSGRLTTTTSHPAGAAARSRSAPAAGQRHGGRAALQVHHEPAHRPLGRCHDAGRRGAARASDRAPCAP